MRGTPRTTAAERQGAGGRSGQAGSLNGTFALHKAPENGAPSVFKDEIMGRGTRMKPDTGPVNVSSIHRL